ncbi:MAG: chemotaxis protein methyltransferase [Methyloceanibacter sp.]|nr:MAG: chemotaxis protein methyltransferase [Methyloceanibacter sp.]
MMMHEFEALRRVLRDYSGAELKENTIAIVDAKLAPVLKAFRLLSIGDLTAALMRPGNDCLRQCVAEAVAVNESYFFRNRECFSYLSDVLLPRLMERRAHTRRIRIWCAACSTGQEPYSLAMLLADMSAALDGWTVEILATDFSQAALRKARDGLYTQFEVQRGLPAAKLIEYFEKPDGAWQIKPEIRRRVVFREHNLLEDCAGFGRFDVILCRNVMIYFDAALRATVLKRLAGRLEPDGYLILGAAETTTGFSRDFVRVPDNPSGVFCLDPGAAHTGEGPGPWAGRKEPMAQFRSVELDRATVDRLEAKARARGLTLAALLAEFAEAGPHAGPSNGLKRG